MNAAADYYEKTLQLLQELRDQELPNVERAAQICADSISRGGLVFLFGNGHSRMMCEEMTPRQGCFVGFAALVELALSNHASIVGSNGLRAPLYLEKYEGYSEEILKGFHFGPHDAFIIISTSGIRPVIVEMAAGAKRRNLPVIAITSRSHCENSAPAHSSGTKLIDHADVVIDNHCPRGNLCSGDRGTRMAHRPYFDHHRRHDYQHAAVLHGRASACARHQTRASAEPSIHRQHERGGATRAFL